MKLLFRIFAASIKSSNKGWHQKVLRYERNSPGSMVTGRAGVVVPLSYFNISFNDWHSRFAFYVNWFSIWDRHHDGRSPSWPYLLGNFKACTVIFYHSQVWYAKNSLTSLWRFALTFEGIGTAAFFSCSIWWSLAATSSWHVYFHTGYDRPLIGRWFPWDVCQNAHLLKHLVTFCPPATWTGRYPFDIIFTNFHFDSIIQLRHSLYGCK